MNIVIIGGNRGIGLELVKQYQSQGHDVLVLCRNTSEELSTFDVKVVKDVDVANDEIIETLASKVEFKKIDILIHVSGILNFDSYPNISMANMRESFEVNSLGPLRTIMALKGKLAQGSKVGILSSRVGSIADNSSSSNYAYRTSKTAVNMIGKCLSLDLKNDGIALALLHPGYVRTDMTQGNGLIDADESAAGLIKQMERLSLETTGIFVHTNGETLPW